MVPSNCVLAPSVVAPPTTQNTSHAVAPFSNVMTVPATVLNAPEIWKMYTPAPLSVRLGEATMLPAPENAYTPGDNVWPLISRFPVLVGNCESASEIAPTSANVALWYSASLAKLAPFVIVGADVIPPAPNPTSPDTKVGSLFEIVCPNKANWLAAPSCGAVTVEAEAAKAVPENATVDITAVTAMKYSGSALLSFT